MIVPLDCPHCQKAIEVAITLDQKNVACPACGGAVTPEIEIKPGVVIGNGYRIEGKLGEDSQVRVFVATQESMQRQVAIKILPPDIAADEEKLKRFQREVKLAANLQHPNILTAYGAGEDCDIHFLIKQYVPGRTLEEICVEQRTIPEKQALKYLIPIAEALKYAWDEGKIIHRNVKPENILISDTGKPMLMDLGIAKSMEPDSMSVTSAGFTVGTPEYMSPEQVRASSNLDFRSDMYCLGICLYRLVTGTVPFEDKSAMAIMQKQLKEVAIPAQFKNPDVSTGCSSVIDKMLAKKREDRYASWSDAIADMKDVLKGNKPTIAGAARKKADDADSNKPSPNNRQKAARKKGRKRQPKAQGISREDVERIAHEMYGRKYFARKLLFYAFSAIIPIAVVGGVFSWYGNKRKQIREIENLYSQAEQMRDEVERQRNYDTVIDKYEQVRKRVNPGTEMYIRCESRIHDLKIARVMFTLNQQANELLRRNQCAAAIRLYETYNGPFAGETVGQRREAAVRLRARCR